MPGDVSSTTAIAAPAAPRSLAETGVAAPQIADLLVKLCYLHGSLNEAGAIDSSRLPAGVIHETLADLGEAGCLRPVRRGSDSTPPRFELTRRGRNRARDAFARCRYVGPAPVSLRSYVAQCRRQRIGGAAAMPLDIGSIFDGLVPRPALLEQLGAALASGAAILLFGGSGNGKSLLARRVGCCLRDSGGEIYVPYAVQVSQAIVTVFDPTWHQTVDDAEELAAERAAVEKTQALSNTHDRRWRRVRRPVVAAASGLTLDLLQPTPNAGQNFFTVPLHIKANGGLMLIDDLGRQPADARALMHRWIPPLEERLDRFTLPSGQGFVLPSEQLLLFTTDLDPDLDLDPGFLRRIPHRIEASPPSAEEFVRRFDQCCAGHKIPPPGQFARNLFASRYSFARPPRWSDPQNLLEVARSICRFRNQEFRLTDELISEAARRFFGRAA